MGVGAPSLFVMVLMCGWPGGLAIVLFQSCWMSRAGGSCGWYCRWRKTVRFVLVDFALRRFSWSSGVWARNANALCVPFVSWQVC